MLEIPQEYQLEADKSLTSRAVADGQVFHYQEEFSLGENIGERNHQFNVKSLTDSSFQNCLSQVKADNERTFLGKIFEKFEDIQSYFHSSYERNNFLEALIDQGWDIPKNENFKLQTCVDEGGRYYRFFKK